MHRVPTQGGSDIGHAAQPQQVEGGIATSGEVGWGPVRPDLASVLPERHIPDVVQAVLDLPVAAPQLLEPRRIRLLRRQAGAGVRPLLARRARLAATAVLPFAVDAADLR